MTKKWKQLAVYAASFVLAELWGVFLSKQYYKSKCEYEVENVRAAYRAMRMARDVSNQFNKVTKAAEDSAKTFEHFGNKMTNVYFDGHDEATTESTRKSYRNIVHNYSEVIPEDQSPAEEAVTEDIYTISPKQFADSEDEKIFLSYYTDKVLVDDSGYIIPIKNNGNPGEAYIPQYVIDNIGEYEEDIVHCRNEILGVDYEIVCDPRAYSDTPFGGVVRYD